MEPIASKQSWNYGHFPLFTKNVIIKILNARVHFLSLQPSKCTSSVFTTKVIISFLSMKILMEKLDTQQTLAKLNNTWFYYLDKLLVFMFASATKNISSFVSFPSFRSCLSLCVCGLEKREGCHCSDTQASTAPNILKCHDYIYKGIYILYI